MTTPRLERFRPQRRSLLRIKSISHRCPRCVSIRSRTRCQPVRSESTTCREVDGIGSRLSDRAFLTEPSSNQRAKSYRQSLILRPASTPSTARCPATTKPVNKPHSSPDNPRGSRARGSAARWGLPRVWLTWGTAELAAMARGALFFGFVALLWAGLDTYQVVTGRRLIGHRIRYSTEAQRSGSSSTRACGLWASAWP